MPRTASPKAKKPAAPNRPKKPVTALSDGRRDNGGKRNPPGGRPPWEPHRKMVENARKDGYREQSLDEAWADARALVQHYVAIGYPQEVIVRLLKPTISDETLRKHFGFELDNGKLIADARVAGTTYQMALRDPAMNRFWCRTRLGWSEKLMIGMDGPILVKMVPGDDAL